ncbi:MAG: thiamine pyrophosphate-binding protein [Yaniella sp.]|uniref:thiamine pyrophosphate-binding protein n=1 Tax=Yaniella sp. TaxID=2773929 RepID=UPI002649D99B|nr:thiamine pyrophosphate-binding protein [Yaniella sp.]MDN5732398.1 thiamine pyrophosphate-binding protein [Yaniella sp.]MDN5815464.1 thiamine pyrophosphate-binding protein [Yaniella sp.]MDN5818798.1 thiamine pyrophosphate-binding protein [Yaniella sp.]MDN5913141.1 thiamine pyrophosphate-binding protein [Yaniella sp.]MDN6149052.1 thiamine pyrophosphate-binding protein [Yaniella sp.]
MRNGGDLVVETLSALGATTVFGIPGQHALGLFDALTRSQLQFISSRVENNSAFAADGYARATHQPGILFVSTGPGALTALAGVQEAYASGVPMLVISSQIPEAGLGGRRKGMLHQLDDQKASARNVTKSQETIHKASSIPYALEDAWQTALTAPQGPVWVEIPQDVLLNETSIPAPGAINVKVPLVEPHAGSIQRAAELLASAKRPAIIAGGGVRRSDGAAQNHLQQLAELVDAPVVCTPGGNTAFPYEHPLSLGGWIEDRYVTEVLENADVLLAVGTSLGEVSSNYFTMEPRGQLIQIDAHVRVLESNYSGLGIRSDASIALAEITSAVQRQGDLATSTWHGKTSGDLARDVQRNIDQRLAKQDLTHEISIMNAIRSAIPDDAVTYWDMTIAGYWAWNVWDARSGAMHSGQGAGGIGYGFPSAFGGAIGQGERVLAVSGDGSAMYSIAELAAAKQHNVPVTWLIIDDGGYGILREYMHGAFGQATATELARPDFVALSESFGIPAVTTDAAGLHEALSQAWSTDGTNLVVLQTTLKMWDATHEM